MTDIVERLETLVRHGRDQGMKMNDVEDAAREIRRLRGAAQAVGMRDALSHLVSVIDAAGLLNLSNGVQLGPTVWYVKASEAMDIARAALAAQPPAAPVETNGTLWGQIAAIYGELDAQDCAW